MATGIPSRSLESYQQGIRFLQRAGLDDQGLIVLPGEIHAAMRTTLDPKTPLPLWLANVQGLARVEEIGSAEGQFTNYSTTDILAGLNGQHIPFYFLIQGEPRRVRIFIGTMADDKGSGATIRATFNSYYPGIKIKPENEIEAASSEEEQKKLSRQWQDLEQELNGVIRPFINACPYVGILTGVPTPNQGKRKEAETQIDRLIRGLYGTHWGMLVLADPLEETSIVEMQMELIHELARLQQEEQFREWREVKAVSVASNYESLLTQQNEIFEGCLFEGGWWMQSYIFSPDQATYQRLKGLVKGVYSGPYARIDRIRVLDCFGASAKAASFSPILVERSPGQAPELGEKLTRSFKYHTLLPSGALSALIHLPRVEMPGYFLHDSTTFDVSSHVPEEVPGIAIGEILNRGQPTGNNYQVPVSELTKHCLLVGITGSGKTNTSKHLLQNFSRMGLPILVIEPAKREYRRIAGSLRTDQKLCVFTIGEEGGNSAPFRLNPFEIRPGVSVQTHIDLLKSVFNASFGMWTPLPQVLERAIHEVYRDKGWDIIRGVNERAQAEGGAAWHAAAQPTLTDLFHTISSLVPKLGYDREVERNVRTALETRINSLRIGAKGLMLDTRSSIPMEHLLAQTTVLELEGVGDDDEKAFIMGLILISLYEYYRSANLPRDWMHITVIEEAHRLLSNAAVSSDPEASNLKGKAVETFVNMLSEVRAYGEGFIIAEQIPTKLAPDVIKNTGLKIMHRTVASDDRTVMGGAMNMDDLQLRQVVALATGEAVVHGGGRYGDDNAILIRIPEVKDTGQKEVTAETIRKYWQEFNAGHRLADRYLPYPTCESTCKPVNSGCSEARRIAEDPLVAGAFTAFVLSLAASSFERDAPGLAGLAGKLYAEMDALIRSHLTGASQDPAGQRCLLTHGLYRFMESRGRQYGWTYEQVGKRILDLLPALVELAGKGTVGGTAGDALHAFCRQYSEMCRLKYEPFVGCSLACGHSPVCLFRYAIEPLVGDEILDSIFTRVGPGEGEALAYACEMAAGRAIPFVSQEASGGRLLAENITRNAAYCFLIQKVNANPANWPPQNRQAVLALMKAWYGEAYHPVAR